MKERQRWRPEEDSLLRAYVKQYGPRDWHLVSERMNSPSLNRDAKSCLERWKNYLKPGIKKGSLTEQEQYLVINLQAKHGNKWKKIAAQVPGRTAKRLGKWWEVKQQRDSKDSKVIQPLDEGKYDHLLETFAEKLVHNAVMPPTTNGGQPSSLPPWMANSSSAPSVTLSLSPLAPPPWISTERVTDPNSNAVVSDLVDCCRELEEGHRAWAAHKKEAAWRLKRVELQLESEKVSRKREKMEEVEAKVKALQEEQKAAVDRIEAEYREQLAGLQREAEMKEQKLAEQWAAKHLRLTKFIEQVGCRPIGNEPNGR